MYILPVAYLAPVPYFRLLVQSEVVIDIRAHYHKQTYANRCQIATAHGIENLAIPVVHTDHTPLAEVRTSDHHAWQMQHWRAMEAAYNASPFFDYYKDELLPFFTQPTDRLVDFTLALHDKITELLDLPLHYTLNNEYQKSYTNSEIDLRETFSTPKNIVTLQPHLQTKPYYQVFEQQWGFMPNLSIVDLLFNMGNEARIVLKN